MAQPPGNTRLKSARIAAGYHSQQALADALRVGVRQVRRWESSAPPWPQGEMAQNLTRLLGQDLQSLGFTPPAGVSTDTVRRPGLPAPAAAATGLAAVPTQAAIIQPSSVATDFTAVTRAHRRLYWSVAPATLHPAAIAHATLGCALLPETAGQTRRAVAAALAETWLLAGRIEFFDLRDANRAQQTLLRALQAAGEADDPLLGAAVLAHTAFIPAWTGDRDAAVERMVAARTYARRGPAPAELLAWLDAVEAECETRCGNTRTALHLIGHAESVLTEDSPHAVPEWLDWFSPVRLAAFKGNTQLLAGHLPQARTTLLQVLEDLDPNEEKQTSVVLGDLAAVEAAAGDPEAACGYARRALDQLERTWYAMGMDRVRDVRRSLAPHQHEACVRDLDDRLYGWATTVSALAR
ncbi:helix-turn-helix transcriptional regulator [Streptomyces sp. ID01-12c]|uniref:helix-turn-helix transcriptional regulator n=1 Tax=Streptomyces caniscabiei TaxID=2746961 RepID=UPI00177C65D2|nr:helix-turn-helix transcriptional regulator [Streptomyces caniscabiei]MBD9703352.1 helix-turn-helix transcriptional regulator [Streptomyces caniscabiei]MDX3726842.1 helix-turn-helix transcriptional regulator [Streptomyces caniscabiei]